MAKHNNETRQLIKKSFRLTTVEKLLGLVILLQLSNILIMLYK